MIASGLLFSAAAQSATLTVTNLGDSGPGTLRQAIADAAPGDSIIMGTAGTIKLFSSLTINKTLSIRTTKNVSVSIESNDIGFGQFVVTAGIVKMTGFTVARGANWGGSGTFSDVGGGLFVASGAWVSLDRMTFEGNEAITGGAVYNEGSLIVLNSTFSNNLALDPGFGCDGGGAGAAIGNQGYLVIRNATFANNHSSCGAVLYQAAPTAVTLMANSLLTNQDGNGGYGGGDLCWILGGSVVSMGHNMQDDSGAGCNLTGAGDQVVTDTLIGPLGNNGGATQTHALLRGSPAIDAGDDASAPGIDQRGVARPSGVASDIGAYEFLVRTGPPAIQ